MFLDIISLLILVIIVIVYLLLAHRIRNYETILMVEKTEIMWRVEKTNAVIADVLTVTQRLLTYQNTLDDKLDVFATFVDKYSVDVTLQQEQFESLVRADMLAARREELLRTKELKIALERLMGVALTSRQPPASNDVLALENLTRRIEELESILERGDI